MNQRTLPRRSDRSPPEKEPASASERPTLVDIELSPDLLESLAATSRPAEPPSSVRPGPLGELRRAFAAGEFEHALTIAEDLLRRDPRDAEASSFAESSRLRMRHVYASRLGSLLRVPFVAVEPKALEAMGLPPRVSALVRRVDGYATYEDILDDAAAPELETLRVLCDLLARGIIGAD